MEIIVYYPKILEDQQELKIRAARIHAEAISLYIKRLSCLTSQKNELIDAIQETFNENHKTSN